jgi:hypothetical protein
MAGNTICALFVRQSGLPGLSSIGWDYFSGHQVKHAMPAAFDGFFAGLKRVYDVINIDPHRERGPRAIRILVGYDVQNQTRCL